MYVFLIWVSGLMRCGIGDDDVEFVRLDEEFVSPSPILRINAPPFLGGRETSFTGRYFLFF